MIRLTKIFGTSGIRGAIKDKVTTDLALDLGRALGTFLEGKGTVGVGTDARTSRQMLENAFVSGIVSTGTNVVRLNGIPMPTTAFHSTLPDISTSVVITASHNPPPDNGFKFFVGGREYIREEEVFLESRVADRHFLVADWSKVGRISTWDVRETYLK
jgi:phosphoglucosamine mutase